jgi:hypothetical protein
LLRRPRRRERLHVLRELLEARALILHERVMVRVTRDQQVHPRQDDRCVRPRLHRKPHVRTRCDRRHPGVQHDQLGPSSASPHEVLYLAVVRVLPQVRAEQHDALCLFEIQRLRTPRSTADRQLVADVPWSPALRIGRGRVVGAAVRHEHLAHQRSAGPVVEERQRLRPVLVFDLLEAARDRLIRRLPPHPLELALSSLTHADHRELQPILVPKEPGARIATPAQTTHRRRRVRVTPQSKNPVLAHVRQHPAVPKAELTERGHRSLGRRDLRRPKHAECMCLTASRGQHTCRRASSDRTDHSASGHGAFILTRHGWDSIRGPGVGAHKPQHR